MIFLLLFYQQIFDDLYSFTFREKSKTSQKTSQKALVNIVEARLAFFPVCICSIWEIQFYIRKLALQN